MPLDLNPGQRQKSERNQAAHSGEMNIPVTRIGKREVPSRRQGSEEPTQLQLFFRKKKLENGALKQTIIDGLLLIR